MRAFARKLRGRGAGLRVLNLGGGGVDSIAKRRTAGKDLGGCPRIITDSQIRNAGRLIEGGETAA